MASPRIGTKPQPKGCSISYRGYAAPFRVRESE